MTKRAMIALAASAAMLPAALSAQTVGDPDPFHGLPNISLAIPAAAAAAAQAAPQVQMQHRGGAGMHGRFPGGTPPVMHHGRFPGGTPPVMHRTPPHGGMGHHPGVVVRHHGGFNRGHGSTRFHSIQRGGIIPSFWFGPQFQIGNWGSYGFSEPFDGGRWIRYYDDAYLIDRDGRVRDGRYGMDWDRYGDDWDYDDDGVPIRVGDDDYDYDDRDDEWAGDHRRGDYGDQHGDRRHDGRRGYAHHGPPMPPPGYGYGYGYGGYGYGWGWGPVIVTETIVTTAPVVETRVYYETVKVAPRRVRRCSCSRPAPPRPRPGERG